MFRYASPLKKLGSIYPATAGWVPLSEIPREIYWLVKAVPKARSNPAGAPEGADGSGDSVAGGCGSSASSLAVAPSAHKSIGNTATTGNSVRQHLPLGIAPSP